ncbi:hypothetical protein BV25DRAFT_1810344 [Artomyces pyxidatus]|uniref:Uncharacterized protein n=1 Tax=Artomyces pyxidatus TaxID=48021 RepID=A0ACB8SQY3_9AGAM|nr:hypothetical protein BV25DRAFT_1810344 [Artomyces pyxidatus]
MDVFPSSSRPHRGRGSQLHGASERGRRGQSKNKTWVSREQGGSRSGTNTPESGTSRLHTDRWERGGPRVTRGRGRGRGHMNGSQSPRPDATVLPHTSEDEDMNMASEALETDLYEHDVMEEPEFDSPEEFDRFYKELEKARDVERDKAVAEGKMNHPTKPRRLDEAITIVGTCMDMCPRFERYTREKRNLLMRWEMKPGTKHVDHKRAVKQYERGGGDKSLPSDLRPPLVLKRTLDYLFHELLPKEGFSPTYSFIRDRTRQVRADFTIQLQNDAIAMECHERCVRYHILVLHFERNTPGFEFPMEEGVLMNALQSLKEFYEDNRKVYQSPNELEMRVYHRLIHMRDQVERHEDIPDHIRTHPVFLLTTKFREHVQKTSSPIFKNSALKVGDEGMAIFAELATYLREQDNRVMIYLVACILERFFGVEKIEGIDSLQEGLTLPEIIDGVREKDGAHIEEENDVHPHEDEPSVQPSGPKPLQPSPTEWLSTNFGPKPTASAIFGNSSSQSSASPFGSSGIATVMPSELFSAATKPKVPSVFGGMPDTSSVFGNKSGSVFGGSGSAFGGSGSAFGSSGSAFSGSGSAFGPPSLASQTSGSTFGTASSPFDTTASNKPAANGEHQLTSVFGGTTGSSLSLFGASTSQSTHPSSSSSTSLFSGTSSSADPEHTPTKHLDWRSTSLNPNAPAFIPPKALTTTSTSSNATAFETLYNGQSATPPSAPGASNRPRLTPLTTSSFPNTPSSSTPPRVPDVAQVEKPHSATYRSPVVDRRPTLIDLSGSESLNIPGMQSPPLQPPALNKVHPISLPPTPTAASFSSPIKPKALRSLFDSSQGSLLDEALSPLDILNPRSSFDSLPSPLSARPSITRLPTTGPSSPLAQRLSVPEFPTLARPASPSKDASSSLSKDVSTSPMSSKAVSLTLPNGKGKGKERAADQGMLADQALAFARTSLVVRNSLRRWVKKAIDRAAWVEAVRRSDAYSERVQRQHLSNGKSVANGKKRRDFSGQAADAQPPHRRIRRRVSSHYTPPRTDAELLERLKENHEQHERRWAKGSFLESIREHVGQIAGKYPFDWRIWLSTNPDNDGTAIWVETKFDVPASGQWDSERIFSVPLTPGDDQSSSPGLIVFECSPLDGINDEIEQKFRILDDCARFRDIIDALPEERHFTPSVIFVIWGEKDQQSDLPSDLLQMVSKYEEQGVLRSTAVFAVSSTTTDLDEKFTNVLSVMELDTVGELVEILSFKEFVLLALVPWQDFAIDWTSRCMADGEVDWYLFCQVLQSLLGLINTSSRHLATRLDPSVDADFLPAIDLKDVNTSDALYECVYAWLETPTLRDISEDFPIHCGENGTHMPLTEFPSAHFIDHLRDLAMRRLEAILCTDKTIKYPISKLDVQTTRQEVEGDISRVAGEFRELFAFYVRPKRPAPDDGYGGSSAPPSPKRLKASLSTFSTLEDMSDVVNGSSNHVQPPPSLTVSPSTSLGTIADDSPRHITIAMLRARSRNVLKNKRRS